MPYAFYAFKTLNSSAGPRALKGNKGDVGNQGAVGKTGNINNQKLVLSNNQDSLIVDSLNSIILPGFITYSIGSIGDRSAQSGGAIINAGIPLSSKKGICWSTNSLPTINDYTSYSAAASSDFKLNIDRLTSNTIYYVRSFIIHNNSVIYGQVESFKTLKSQFEISYQVVSDNNNDSKINKGEKIYLKVSIKNNGTVALKGVKALFSSTDQYVKISDSTKLVSFGNISVNSSMDGNGGTSPNNYTYSFSFEVSKISPLNYFIPIKMRVWDENNIVWNMDFEVKVLATNALLVFDAYSINSDNNGDKTINNGETIKLNVRLWNKGLSNANKVIATYAASSDYITGFISSKEIHYGDINKGTCSWYGNQYNDNVVQFTVKSTTPNKTVIPIIITMVDETGYSWNSNFQIIISPVVIKNKVHSDLFSINSDNNRDETINKGETIKLNVRLKNTGTSTVKGLKMTFTTTSEYVTGFASTANLNYGDISSGSWSWYGNSQTYYNVIHSL